jgi:hypothetical protein
VVLLLIEAPKIRRSIMRLLSKERGKRYRHIGKIIARNVSGYVLGDMLTSVIAGVIVFITLIAVGVPYPFSGRSGSPSSTSCPRSAAPWRASPRCSSPSLTR